MNKSLHFGPRVWASAFLSLLFAAGLTACGGSSSSSSDAQTAPGIDVVPQQNYATSSGASSVDTTKFNAIQSNYQSNLGVSK